MIKELFTGLSLVCMLAGTGCTKDQNEFIQSPGTDTTWVTQIATGDAIEQLADTLSSPSSTTSINLSANTDLVSAAGLQFTLPNGWTASGSAYTGGATLQAVWLQNPGMWIRNFVSTTYGGKLIRPDAILYYTLQTGGEALQPTGSVFVSMPAAGSTFEEDSLFSGGYSDNLLQWTGMTSPSYFEQTADSVTFSTTQTGWLMYGTPLADSVNTNAQLVVVLPNQFTNANSAVFCLLKGYPALVSLTGNYASKTFTASGLPAGSPATIISLTLTGGTIYLGTQDITLTNGMLSVAISPGIETFSSLTAYLQQL